MHDIMVSTRTGFGQGLIELAAQRSNVYVASADTYRSFALGDFVKLYPERYLEFGISEQNMLTASAALSCDDHIVFSVGYSPFLSMRALEQIRTFIAYPRLNVKIAAGLGGLSGDTDGVTHQGTEDLALVRALPNVKLLCPADAVAAKAFVKIAADIDGPVYLRLGRGATPVFYPEDEPFVYGKAKRVCDLGSDIAIIATGPCVYEALKAAKALKEQGIGARVLDMHTIKPLDEEAVCAAAEECGGILTVEDGTIYGGLGGAVAEVLAEKNCVPKVFRRLGMHSFGTGGKLPELLGFFGLDTKGIEASVKEMLR